MFVKLPNARTHTHTASDMSPGFLWMPDIVVSWVGWVSSPSPCPLAVRLAFCLVTSPAFMLYHGRFGEPIRKCVTRLFRQCYLPLSPFLRTTCMYVCVIQLKFSSSRAFASSFLNWEAKDSETLRNFLLSSPLSFFQEQKWKIWVTFMFIAVDRKAWWTRKHARSQEKWINKHVGWWRL